MLPVPKISRDEKLMLEAIFFSCNRKRITDGSNVVNFRRIGFFHKYPLNSLFDRTKTQLLYRTTARRRAWLLAPPSPLLRRTLPTCTSRRTNEYASKTAKKWDMGRQYIQNNFSMRIELVCCMPCSCRQARERESGAYVRQPTTSSAYSATWESLLVVVPVSAAGQQWCHHLLAIVSSNIPFPSLLLLQSKWRLLQHLLSSKVHRVSVVHWIVMYFPILYILRRMT